MRTWRSEPSVSSAHLGLAGPWQGRGHQDPGKWASPQTRQLPWGLPGRGFSSSAKAGTGVGGRPLLTLHCGCL